jgi:hypothetical protein
LKPHPHGPGPHLFSGQQVLRGFTYATAAATRLQVRDWQGLADELVEEDDMTGISCTESEFR